MGSSQICNKLKEKATYAYVLTLSNRYDRHQHIYDELNKIGYNIKEDINRWLNYSFTTTFPYNDIIIDAINKSGKGRFTKPNEFDCARNHYKMVKTAYDLGYKNILIMEDDIMFYKNEDYFINALDNIPDDYDILMFGGFTTDPKIIDLMNNNSSEYWIKNTEVGIWNNSMYMLSRKGMEYYIAFMDKFLWVADGPLYKAPLNHHIVNTYISSIPLVIQCDKEKISSDIRDKNNDNIDYNTQNLYEKFVNIEDYQ